MHGEQETAPSFMSIPNTKGMASAIDSRPPIPGVAPTMRPISTAISMMPIIRGDVSIA